MRTFQRNKILKVVYWRILSFTLAGLISWAYLDELRKSLELTVILTVVMTVVHYIFELGWEQRYERRNISEDNSPRE